MAEQEIRIEYVDFREVEKWPRNPKDHDVHEIKKSFNRFGFVNPVIVDETTGKLVAGHGRLDTLRFMKDGNQEPPSRVKVVDDKWLIPVLMGVAFKNPAEAESYLLADNKLSEIGGWRKDILKVILSEMVDVDGALDGTGFSIDDIISPSGDENFLDEDEIAEAKHGLKHGVFISVGFCDMTILPKHEHFDTFYNFSGEHREFTEAERQAVILSIVEGINALGTRTENTDSGE